MPPENKYERQSKSSRNSLILTVWCTMSSYLLDKVLLVIFMCKFCRGCALQFRGSGAKSGRQEQWFLHHDNVPSHTSLVVQQFLSSPNHRTLRTSLRVAFGCSLPWKWASRGHVSQPWWTLNPMQRPDCGRLQNKPSHGASNNGRFDTTSVCV
jgi:hypothetical protein